MTRPDQSVSTGRSVQPSNSNFPSPPSLSAFGLLREGWRVFWAHPMLLLCATLLAVLIPLVADVLISAPRLAAGWGLPQELATVLRVAGMTLLCSFLLALQPAFLHLLVEIARGRGALRDLWSAVPAWATLVPVTFIVLLLEAEGFSLLLIPGIILMIGFGFAPLVAVDSAAAARRRKRAAPGMEEAGNTEDAGDDWIRRLREKTVGPKAALRRKGLGVIDSLRASWRLTRGNRGTLFFYTVISGAIALLSVGLLGGAATLAAFSRLEEGSVFVGGLAWLIFIGIPLLLLTLCGRAAAYAALLAPYDGPDGPDFALLGGPRNPEGPNLSPLYLLGEGWRICNARPAAIYALWLTPALATTLLLILPECIVALFPAVSVPTAEAVRWALSPLLVLVYVTVLPGMACFMLGIRRGQGGRDDLLRAFASPLQLAAVFLILSLLILLGNLALYIPGIILGLGLAFAPLAFLDDAPGYRLGVIGSLRESWRLTRGHKWKIFEYHFFFMLLLFPLAFVGQAAYSLGNAFAAQRSAAAAALLPFLLFVFIPALLVMQGGWVAAYDELRGRMGTAESSIPGDLEPQKTA